MKRSTLVVLIVLGVFFGAVVAYKIFGHVMMMKYFATQKEPPVTVSTYVVHTQAWVPVISAVGTARAAQGVDVTSEVSGIVSEVAVVSGQTVKAGQTLLRMNSDVDDAQLRALKASAMLAKVNHERNIRQFEIQAVSKATLDASEAELTRSDAAVRQQEALLAKKSIAAPFDGRVGVCPVNVGQYLSPGETIVTLQRLDTVYVDFYLPQQDVLRIAQGQNVTVSCDAAPGRVFEGTVSAIDPKVDRATRNVLVQATVPNEDGVLLSGMFVSVGLSAGEPVEYLTVPQAAVAFNPYGETLFVVKDGERDAQGRVAQKAVQTFVATGESRGDQVAVLTGLKEGDTIVSSGHHKLRNGSLIIVNNEITPSNDAAPRPQDR